MTKPSPPQIHDAEPLSASPHRVPDVMALCHICGVAAREMRLFRECDERDKPFPGDAFLIFIGTDHAECYRKLDQHPRMYLEQRGDPGRFPRLCGPCVHRERLRCTNPQLGANGGPGLRVGLSGLGTMVACIRGGALPPPEALDCEGQRLPGETS